MKLLVGLIVLLASSKADGRIEHYRGDQVWRITLEDEGDLKWLHEIGGKMNMDFWTDPSMVRPVDVMIPRGMAGEFSSMLNKRDITYRVLKKDLQDDVDKSYHDATMASKDKVGVGILALADFDYTIYHTYEEIQQWVADVASEYEFVTNFTFGTTYEGRTIGALKIEAPRGAGATDPKPIVYFEGGIHAREWISPATVMYFTGKLLRQYAEGEADAMRVLGMFDLHIVPSLNCDGYVFTWTDLAAAEAMAAAMNATNNVPGGYIHGPSAVTIYEAAGASNDYGYAGTPDATYTYVVELRDTGEYGFLLPPDQIEPTGEESYDGVIALLGYVIDNDYN